MIPNEQKRIYQQNMKPEKGPDPVLNLQLYQPPRPKQNAVQSQYPNPAVFYPNYVPNPFNPTEYANYMHQQYGIMQPVYKEYNINIGGVEGSHVKTAMLFEDALPVKNVAGTFQSIGERMTMYEYIRSVMFPAGDGHDIPIDSESKNILSHLKFMDMNPYNASRFSRNPYKGLPFGLLLFRSCYPIRHDAKNASAICANNSTGINVRIYRMTEGAYLINKQNQTTITDYDEWRDITFYNFCKEQILKKKMCPNFPTMYGYNITLNSGIHFDEMKLIQEPNRQDRGTLTVGSMLGSKPVTQNKLANPMNSVNKVIVMENPMNDPKNLNKYFGKALVCLTEASNYNLLGWAKMEYRADGNIKRMINTGYHTKNVWESVLFQMFAALYCMQLKGVVINNFKIDRNVFIKDISIGGNVTTHWKYIIDGIEYYVPNHGYLVLIDTNFRDFDQSVEGKETDQTRMRKLDGKCFGNACRMDDMQLMDQTFEMFRTAVDQNVFGQDFVNDGGVKPPEDVMRLLGLIRLEADQRPTLTIGYYIRKYMTMFLNNRVGTLLTNDEKLLVRVGAVKEFRKGQIVSYADIDGYLRCVIHVETKNNEISRIITKDSIDPHKANIIEKDVPITSLGEFSVVDSIKQTFKHDANLSEEALLETYNLQ
jgi:hypothetical protein